MGKDRVEILPQVLCPVCGALFDVSGRRPVMKKPAGSRSDDDIWEKTYIVDCGNQHCPDYRKVKFLKARYQEVEFHWVD